MSGHTCPLLLKEKVSLTSFVIIITAFLDCNRKEGGKGPDTDSDGDDDDDNDARCASTSRQVSSCRHCNVPEPLELHVNFLIFCLWRECVI